MFALDLVILECQSKHCGLKFMVQGKENPKDVACSFCGCKKFDFPEHTGSVIRNIICL
ncbi:MAG: hypothetical protein ACT4ON_13600 [Bacteroidota bacterium]